MNKLSIFLGALGIIILILAIVLGFVVFPKTVKNKIKQELKLTRGCGVWNKWVDIDSPIFISFYIFNVTNAAQVIDGSESPNLAEVGPYVYRQRRTKIDPHSEYCKETVIYSQRITYWFDEIRSCLDCTEDDLVNVVNVPFISVISGLPAAVVSDVAKYILYAEHLIRTDVPVGEILFKGFDVSTYDHPLLAPNLPPEFSGFTFGLYKGRKKSTDGVYEIYSAAKTSQSERFGQIKTWNGNASLNIWNNTECDRLSGTDGSIFRSYLEKEDSITIFNSDLCRLLKLTYDDEVTVKDVKGYRFTLPKQELQGAANNPSNQCYCLKQNQAECQDGVIDVSRCRRGAPIMYWFGGYEGYAKLVGLVGKADGAKHQTQIDIEPRTGLLLEAHKRIQINMEVRKIADVPQLENVKETFLFPAVWIDEEASICDLDVDDMKSRIDKPIRIVTIVRWVAIGVGALLLVLALAAPHACKKMKNSRSSENITLKNTTTI